MYRTIDAFVESHYYSETHEFESAARSFVNSLCDGLRDVYRRTVLERLQKDPSLVNILLCSGGEIPGAGPWLAARLDEETSASQVSRALIRILADYPGEDEYRAVARFLESDQESEALRSLARMDWERTLPRLLKAAENPGLHTPVLHILHERKKAVGLPILIQEWTTFAAAHLRFDAASLKQVLTGAPAPYNPFQANEIAALLNALPLA
jgi:hypothetical protein